MDLEQRIQRLEDIEAIRYLQAKYQRSLDARDFNSIAECFSDDVVSAYGNGQMSFNGKDQVIGFLMQSMSVEMPSAHMIHGGEIDVNGDTATGKWYLQDFLIVKGHGINIHGAAIYENTYKKIDGVWKIVKIGYTRLYEYKDMSSDVQKKTLEKTTYLDQIKEKSIDEFTGYNKAFKQMILDAEAKK